MPKDFEAGFVTQLGVPRGTEPINIVSIQWEIEGDYVDYSDVDKIISISGLDALERVSGGGGIGSVTVTLDDTDGSIETILLATDPHKRKARIVQGFVGYSPPVGEDPTYPIFTGEVSSPISYSEKDRTITLDIVTFVEGDEIGFSVEEDDLFDEFIDETAFGKAWPLCFGSPIRVPAIKIHESVRGTSLTRYGAITLGDLNDLCDKARTFADAESQKIIRDQDLINFNNDLDQESISNFAGAKSALDTTLASLVFDSPTQEAAMSVYIQTCIDIRKAERNVTLFSGIAVEAQNQIDILGPQVDSLDIQILDAQAIPDAALASTLQDARDLALDGQQEDAGAGVEGIKGLNNYIADFANAIVQVQSNNDFIELTEELQQDQEDALLEIVLTTLLIQEGEKFPQGTPVEIIVNGAKFGGSFVGEIFTIAEANLPLFTNLTITQGAISSEFDLPDTSINLKGQYCFTGDTVFFVVDQDETTCTFTPPLFEKTGELLFGVLGRDIYDTKNMTTTILETSSLFLPTWRNILLHQIDEVFHESGQASGENLGSSRFEFANGLDNIRAADFGIEVGDIIYLATGYEETYVANLIESLEIREVMAFRKIDDARTLVPIPSRYYTTNLAEEIAGQIATVLRFPLPLSEYVDEEWEDTVYVTLISTVGPNTADIIQYIVETYTNLTMDAGALAFVQPLLEKFPSHFAILDRPEALTIVNDIAYQARCAIFVRNEEVVLKFLAINPLNIRTLNEDNVAVDSVQITYTPTTEELITKLTAVWRRNYAQEDEDLGEVNKIVLRNNIPIYGLLEDEREFFIYNIQELVFRAATFWMIRRSNTWYYIKLRGYLDLLELEPYDGVAFAFNTSDHPLLIDITVSALHSYVTNLEYDSDNKVVSLSIWRPIPAKRTAPHDFAYPASASAGTTFPTDFDEFPGGAAFL